MLTGLNFPGAIGKQRQQDRKLRAMKADDRKKEILDCAKKLFSKQGYYETHISHIIQEAKIARGTVYQYFDNKDDIFVTLVDNYFTKWRKMVSIQQANIDLKEISAKVFFQHRIRQTFFFLAEDSDLCNIALRVGLGLPDKVSMMVDRFDKKITDLIAEDIKMGQQFKKVRDSLDVEITAVILTGALLRTAYHYFVKKKRMKGYSKNHIEQITDEFINIFMAGVFTPKYNSNN
jgi:AcrR family transcriptional regulator